MVFYLEIMSLLAHKFSPSLQIKKGNNALEREKKSIKLNPTSFPGPLPWERGLTEPRHLKVDLDLSHGRFEIFVLSENTDHYSAVKLKK